MKFATTLLQVDEAGPAAKDGAGAEVEEEDVAGVVAGAGPKGEVLDNNTTKTADGPVAVEGEVEAEELVVNQEDQAADSDTDHALAQLGEEEMAKLMAEPIPGLNDVSAGCLNSMANGMCSPNPN